jgi:hypothetical protein
MRGLRSTIVLLIVLLGLGAYIYYGLPAQSEGDGEPRERLFADLEADQIDRITITSESGDTTTVRKIGEEWRMTSPLDTKADASEIASLTNNLDRLEVTRVIDENPANLAEYGLESPRVEIELGTPGTEGAGQTYRMSIGASSPTGGDVFASSATSPRVVLIPGYLEAIFNRSTFNLRDKTLLTFERDALTGITVAADGRTLELVKENDEWKLVKPVEALADSVAVDSLIGRLQSAMMKSVVTEEAAPEELRKLGFDKPQATVTLTSGGTMTSLEIGGNAEGEDVYVRSTARPLVATLEPSLVTELRKEAADYRRKEIFAFRGFSTDRLELTRDGTSFTFEKSSAEGEADTWQRTSPTQGEPDAASMQTLLTRLEGLRAASFVDARTAAAALSMPALTVHARFEDGAKEERVSFGRAGSDVYVAVPGQPGAATISESAFDEVIAAFENVAK